MSQPLSSRNRIPSTAESQSEEGLRGNPSLAILITRLVASLAQTTAQLPGTSNAAQSGTSNNDPVASLPESTRPALLTLHLLYPHILLDALDLLDRGCVIQLNVSRDAEPRQDHTSTNATQHDTAQDGVLTQQRRAILAEMTEADNAGSQGERDDVDSPLNQHSFAQLGPSGIRAVDQSDECRHYFVRSAQPPPHRYTTQSTESPYVQSKGYAVHLTAWNCSCPAFAYAAFTDDGRASEEANVRIGAVTGHMGNSRNGEDRGKTVPDSSLAKLPFALRYGFGGLAFFGGGPFDTLADGSRHRAGLTLRSEHAVGLPPCCKHLMACVLAETMPQVFAVVSSESAGGAPETDIRGVIKRWVDYEEAAGWAAGAGFE